MQLHRLCQLAAATKAGIIALAASRRAVAAAAATAVAVARAGRYHARSGGGGGVGCVEGGNCGDRWLLLGFL